MVVTSEHAIHLSVIVAVIFRIVPDWMKIFVSRWFERHWMVNTKFILDITFRRRWRFSTSRSRWCSRSKWGGRFPCRQVSCRTRTSWSRGIGRVVSAAACYLDHLLSITVTIWGSNWGNICSPSTFHAIFQFFSSAKFHFYFGWMSLSRPPTQFGRESFHVLGTAMHFRWRRKARDANFCSPLAFNTWFSLMADETLALRGNFAQIPSAVHTKLDTIMKWPPLDNTSSFTEIMR